MDPAEDDTNVYTEKHSDNLFKRTEVLAGEEPGGGLVGASLNRPVWLSDIQRCRPSLLNVTFLPRVTVWGSVSFQSERQELDKCSLFSLHSLILQLGARRGKLGTELVQNSWAWGDGRMWSSISLAPSHPDIKKKLEKEKSFMGGGGQLTLVTPRALRMLSLIVTDLTKAVTFWFSRGRFVGFQNT